MDSARWLVVFSVVFFMILTLSLLQRFSGYEEEVKNSSQSIQQTDTESAKEAQVFKRDNIQIHGKKVKIKYSKRPSHLFAADMPEDFQRENTEFKNKGKIIE
ncbi:MAG: hypothetical protein ACQETH_01585 [Candidatus Rifleibacteriota bacterium]